MIMIHLEGGLVDAVYSDGSLVGTKVLVADYDTGDIAEDEVENLTSICGMEVFPKVMVVEALNDQAIIEIKKILEKEGGDA